MAKKNSGLTYAGKNIEDVDIANELSYLSKLQDQGNSWATQQIGKLTGVKHQYDELNRTPRTSGGGVPTVQKPKMMSISDMANLWGITYQQDDILKIMKDATNAKYSQYTTDVKQNNELVTNQLSDQYQQYSNLVRSNRSNAASNGVSKGMAAAQEIMALLGAQQTGSEVMTEGARLTNELNNNWASQLAADEYNALQQSNATKSAMAGLAVNANANDVQLAAAQAALQATLAEITGNKDIATINKEASEYNALKNYEANVYSADRNYDAQALYGGGGSSQTDFQKNVSFFMGEGMTLAQALLAMGLDEKTIKQMGLKLGEQTTNNVVPSNYSYPYLNPNDPRVPSTITDLDAFTKMMQDLINTQYGIK